MVYCGECGKRRGLPLPPVRTATEPCGFCKSFEIGETHRTVGRPGNRRRVADRKNMKNFEYPDELINEAESGFGGRYVPGVTVTTN